MLGLGPGTFSTFYKVPFSMSKPQPTLPALSVHLEHPHPSSGTEGVSAVVGKQE